MAREIPGAQHQIINGCGHTVILEKPMELAQILYSFVQTRVLDRFEYTENNRIEGVLR